jgi:2-dehydropantoate 2-reductase
MKIVVFGAGAMGSFIGGLLSRKYEVTLIGRKPHIDAINTIGLKITGETDLLCRPPSFIRVTDLETKPDLLILTVKSYDTETAIKQALPIVEDHTTILSIQNGIGNIETIKKWVDHEGLQSQILGGTTCHGVTFIEPGHVHHAGSGDTIIGCFDRRNTTVTEEVSKMFNSVGLNSTVTTDISGELWSKGIVNASINPITAITGLKNRYILELQGLKMLMEQTCRESVSVAKAEGIKLDVNGLIGRTHSVIRQTGENKSSMLQDLERGKRTEIDAINGVIIETAKRHGIQTPINSVLYTLVKGIEKSMRH